jgi:hypothetical protein
MTITTTIVSVLRRFEYLLERSNVLDHYNNYYLMIVGNSYLCINPKKCIFISESGFSSRGGAET